MRIYSCIHNCHKKTLSPFRVVCYEEKSGEDPLHQAESAQHAATGRAEAIRYSSELARAKTSYDQALTQSDFAHLVLGRECLAKRVHPPGVEKEVQEIERR